MGYCDTNLRHPGQTFLVAFIHFATTSRASTKLLMMKNSTQAIRKEIFGDSGREQHLSIQMNQWSHKLWRHVVWHFSCHWSHWVRCGQWFWRCFGGWNQQCMASMGLHDLKFSPAMWNFYLQTPAETKHFDEIKPNVLVNDDCTSSLSLHALDCNNNVYCYFINEEWHGHSNSVKACPRYLRWFLNAPAGRKSVFNFLGKTNSKPQQSTVTKSFLMFQFSDPQLKSCRLYLHRITSTVISWAYMWHFRQPNYSWWRIRQELSGKRSPLIVMTEQQLSIRVS